jgi:hypothetical protein
MLSGTNNQICNCKLKLLYWFKSHFFHLYNVTSFMNQQFLCVTFLLTEWRNFWADPPECDEVRDASSRQRLRRLSRSMAPDRRRMRTSTKWASTSWASKRQKFSTYLYIWFNFCFWGDSFFFYFFYSHFSHCCCNDTLHHQYDDVIFFLPCYCYCHSFDEL